MCPIITDPRARREALKHAGKCYNCLRPGHLSRSCQSKATCFTCGLRNHSSICSQNMMGKGIAQASSTNAMIPLSPQLGAGLPSNTENNQSKPVTTAFINQKSGVLLQQHQLQFVDPINLRFLYRLEFYSILGHKSLMFLRGLRRL